MADQGCRPFSCRKAAAVLAIVLASSCLSSGGYNARGFPEAGRRGGAVLAPRRSVRKSARSLLQEGQQVTNDSPFPSHCGGVITKLSLLLRWVRQAQFVGYIAASRKHYYWDRCLDVEVLDIEAARRYNSSGPDQEIRIPWFAQFLEGISNGEDLLHISQVFRQSQWRYFGFPVPSTSPAASVQNFGDLRSGMRFGVSAIDLESPTKALVTKYGKTFCGAVDWRSSNSTPVECKGNEDIVFVPYGFDMTQGPKLGLEFAQGMMYNELGKLLSQTQDGEFLYTVNAPGAYNNIRVYDPADVDNLQFPEDGLMISKEWSESSDSHMAAVQSFLEASYLGWMHCRDEEEACVQLVASPGGNADQQRFYTAQRWQMREVNRAIWPSPSGIGQHNYRVYDEAVASAVSIGLVNGSNQNIQNYRDFIADGPTIKATLRLAQDDYDITAEGYDKGELSLCINTDGVAYVCEPGGESLGGLKTYQTVLCALAGVSVVLVLLGLLGFHIRSLRKKLNALQHEGKTSNKSLDLEAPITKVNNLLSKLGDNGDLNLPGYLLEEISAIQELLHRSSNLNIPDLERQLLNMDGSLYTEQLANHLIDSLLLEAEEPHSEAGTVSSPFSTPSRTPYGSFTSSKSALGTQMHKLCGNGLDDRMDIEQMSSADRALHDMCNFEVAVHPEADDMMASVRPQAG